MKYAPYFCEENIWYLAGDSRIADRERFVVFISNPDRCCPLWGQRAATAPSQPVFWDYHVVLLAATVDGWSVWDLDTVLGCPVTLQSYLAQTFRPLRPEFAHLAPLFRVIDSATYRGQFSSDRSHMRAGDGEWLQPPPPWPAITNEGAPSFLQWSRISPGEPDVYTLEQLGRTFAD